MPKQRKRGRLRNQSQSRQHKSHQLKHNLNVKVPSPPNLSQANPNPQLKLDGLIIHTFPKIPHKREKENPQRNQPQSRNLTNLPKIFMENPRPVTLLISFARLQMIKS